MLLSHLAVVFHSPVCLSAHQFIPLFVALLAGARLCVQHLHPSLLLFCIYRTPARLSRKGTALISIMMYIFIRDHGLYEERHRSRCVVGECAQYI
jgi:hypothetical protein